MAKFRDFVARQLPVHEGPQRVDGGVSVSSICVVTLDAQH